MMSDTEKNSGGSESQVEDGAKAPAAEDGAGGAEKKAPDTSGGIKTLEDALGALHAAREDAAKWRTLCQETRAKLEGMKTAEEFEKAVGESNARIEELTRQLAERDLRAKVRSQFAAIPDELFGIIPNGSEEDMVVAAKKLAAHFEGGGVQQGLPRRGGGLAPGEQGEEFDPQKFVAGIPRR